VLARVYVIFVSFYRAMLRSTERGYATACRLPVSVCPSLTFRYRDHIGWNTSKIISSLISLRLLLGLTPTRAIWSNGNTFKIRVEWGWGHELISTKTGNISETVQDRTKVTMTDR